MANPVRALWMHRRALAHLVRWDLTGRYAGSLGGVIWALFLPLLSVGIYIVVFSLTLDVRMGALPGEGSFGVYLVAGLLPWLALQDGVQRSTTCLTDRRNLLLQVPLPAPLLPLSVVLSALIQELVALLVFLLFAWVYGVGPSPLWPLLLLILPVQLALTTGIALLVSHLHAVTRDTGPLVQAGLLLWFFATPIVYPVHLVPHGVRLLVDLNPLVPLVEAYRDVILIGRWPELTGVIYGVGFAAAMLLLGVSVARATRDQIPEWI